MINGKPKAFTKNAANFYLWVHLTLCFVCMGSFLSIPLMNISHFFAVLSIITFFISAPASARFRLPISAWMLIFFAAALALSTLINIQNGTARHLSLPFTKLRYYIIPALFIFPLHYFLQDLPPTRLKLYVYLVLASSIIGNAAGIYTFYNSGYNPLKLTLNIGCAERNCGMFDTMTYSHNSALLGLLLVWCFNRTRINKKLIVCAGIFFITGFYLSFTVGAWLSLCTGVALFYAKNIKKMLICFFALTLGVAIIFSLPITQSARPQYAYSQSVRIGLWQAAFIALKNNPVVGIGFLNFEKQSTHIKKQHAISYPDFQGHAHSNYFQFFSEGGLLAGILFLGWLAGWLYDLRQRRDDVSLIGYATLAAVAIGGLTQSTLIFAGNCFIIFIIYSMTMAFPRLKPSAIEANDPASFIPHP